MAGALLLAYAVAFPAPAQAQSTDPVWSTMMTVGVHTSGNRGYSSSEFGSLDLDNFTVGPDPYTVRSVNVTGTGQISFVISENLSDSEDYFLELAGETLPLSENADIRLTNFVWIDDWTLANAPSLAPDMVETTLPDGGMVQVCLRTATQDCPGGTITSTPVTIESQHEEIGGGVEDLTFTLTREGETTDALDVKVTIVQDQAWLSDLEYTVTFPIGEASVDLTIEATEFSFTPSTTGDLTARVSGDGISGGEDIVLIISISEPPITISYDMLAYTFAEEATDAEVYAVATLDTAYPRAPSPSRNFFLSFATRSDTAKNPEDFNAVSLAAEFTHGLYALDVDTDQFVARIPLSTFAIEDDHIYEGPEQFGLIVEAYPGYPVGIAQLRNTDGTTCTLFVDCPNPPLPYPVNITDEDDRPVLSLSVAPSSIAEEDDDGTTAVAENVSTVTVEITNDPPKTFAVDQTVTLTFSGATEGTHYSVSPEAADTNAAGHQVVLLKETASAPPVTVTAVGNDTADGNLTLTVAGDLDGTAIGTRDITILDDETTTTTDPFLWSTTMTVGASTGTDRGFDSGKGYGSLDDGDFTEGGNDISVTRLSAASDVTFELSSALSDAGSYILEWAGETLPLDEADVLPSGAFNWNVSWINANASSLNASNYQTTLAVGGRVQVCLRTATEDCPEITTTNTAATGKPSITGTPQVGQTLTAGLGTIADAEDLPTTTFPLGYSFQWVKVATGNVETNVGANSITYSPLAADEGSTIRVDVSFTDGAGNLETVPSDVKGPVVPAAEDCASDRPGNDWCTTMTVEEASITAGATFGFSSPGLGQLDDITIVYDRSYEVQTIVINEIANPDIVVVDLDADVPLGTVFNLGGRSSRPTPTANQVLRVCITGTAPRTSPGSTARRSR